MLHIYNTLSRRKEPFKPINPGQVRMYVCGMTVYDYCHVGHARVMVVFDMVLRWLRASGNEVTYVRNITDIDDKIIQRAIQNKEPIAALTQRFIDAMHEDADALGVERPTFEPRATDYVRQMQGLIGRLMEKGLAYQGSDGDVNFAVRRFPGYGKLSGKSLDDLQAGERVAVGDGKQDPFDFVLWKSAKQEEPADTRWASPWGEGRPGWHIECSAMSCELLGEHFDIHGGGADLQFPHHENEIAQSEGVFRSFDDKGQSQDPPFVNTWMHNGHVRVNDEKMSKSLGNFFVIRDVLKQYDPEVVRFFILRAHYRSPVNYSDVTLTDAKQGLERLYTALSGIEDIPNYGKASEWRSRFAQAMNDDFNTPEAIAVLFELSTELNKAKNTNSDQQKDLARELKQLAGMLGFLQRDPREFLQGGAQALDGLSADQVEALIVERTEAKKAKNFARSDEIRNDLLKQGIVLEDKPGGLTEWRKA
jgi:cysteinyl-tRNA synthetase